MNLALSNLALPDYVDDHTFSSFSNQGLKGIEIAPAKIAPWGTQSKDKFHDFRSRLANNGLVVSSLQAILYGVEGLALLKDEKAFIRLNDHIEHVGRVAEWLDVKVAVLGSPKQRSRGNLTPEEAFDLGVIRLGKLAQNAHRFGMCLGLEPVPAFYGGDFLPSWREVQAMVNAVDHPALGVHLDTGCIFLDNESISDAVHACKDNLVHFQLAEPSLGSFEAPLTDHTGAAKALYEISYDKWISIEMLQQQGGVASAVQAIDYAVKTYGTTTRPR